MPQADTIFALATPPGASVAALMRVSGPLCPAIARQWTDADWTRGTRVTRIPLPAGDVPCLVLASPAPRSFTCEDTLELLLPGQQALVSQLEKQLATLGCRRAQPGEFTRRALQSGRITATQAAGMLALVNAQTDAEHRRAHEELSGAAAARVMQLARRLRDLSARHEMLFDFSEEEHAPQEQAGLTAELAALVAELGEFCGQPPRPPRPEPLVALFGPPNAGKSTLFNALLGVPRALVSPLPGTTRDPVRALLVVEGRNALLADLSGVGQTDADAGRFGKAARDAALEADVLLVLAAPGQHEAALAEFHALCLCDSTLAGRSLLVHTMADLSAGPPPPSTMPAVALSAASGAGLAQLRLELASRLARASLGSGFSLLRERAGQAHDVLRAALADRDMPMEARARELRHALVLLDEGLLADAPGDVLDHIFSRFCIGK
ncbi:MAG: 50S ribosome-binding GTPase [Planctomycetes bacterium]|nr:50S ribosome-binding GTPase [Planctomycetota bacterium]